MTDKTALLARAAEMRRQPTEPERRLWQALRNSQLGGHKFRRQATIGHSIVDFFCPAKGLVVEVDGDTHDADVDAARDMRMTEEFGFQVIRINNADVMTNLDGVLESLLLQLAQRPDRWPGSTTPDPSSEEAGR